MPDPEALDTHARALAASGDAVHSGVNDAARSWAGLSGAYEAPEAGQVLAGFTPVLSRSQDLAALTGKAATILGAYADRARELKHRITALRADIVALDGLIGGNDNWQSHLNIVDRHRETMDKASALAQAILDSDAACATELSALTGGERYNAPAIPRATLDGSTDLIANGLTHAQHFFGTDQDLPDLPWGPPNVSLRLGGPGSAGQGFVSALLGAGQGLHTMLGTTDKVKQTQAWQGMFALGAAAVTTKAVIDRGFRDTTAEDLDAVLTVGGALKETIHYDDWATDPWHAAGATGFDVASLLAGGTGAGIKAGSTAGKLGAETAALSKAATGLTGAARTALSETTAAVTAKLAQARTAIWNDGIGNALDKLDTGLAKLNHTLNGHGSQPAPAGIPHQLPTPATETPWLAKVDKTGGAGAKTLPAPEPGPSIFDQTLGDPSLPGRHPDHQPTIGDTDGGPGSWQEPIGGRSKNGVADQIFGTGVAATGPKGYLLEYIVDYVQPGGMHTTVDFDGHLWRGHPPTEVFQEVKGNYDLLFRGVYDGRYLRNQAVPTAINDWVQDSVRRQIQALEARAPGAHLEWLFTHNEELAMLMEKAVTRYLERNRVSVTVDVRFAPREG
ncbi:hypothetical protein ACFRJ9_02445 [Paenarthrobacter sp. NPDC056912]|uniref:hypothetical protein n=1 Tax=Paenarthrobacter sp. NPDC056912 TaxID=3345965 RepID=UPI003672F25E